MPKFHEATFTFMPLFVMALKAWQRASFDQVPWTYTSYYIKRPLKLVYNILYSILEVFNLFYELSGT